MHTALFTRPARTLTGVLLVVLGSGGCVYQPLALSRPPGSDAGDPGGVVSGDSATHPGDARPGDPSPGDPALPGDPAVLGDPVLQPSCGNLLITGSTTAWQVGNTVIIPRQSDTASIVLTASAQGCDVTWAIDASLACASSRPPPCSTATSDRDHAAFDQPGLTPVVGQLTATVIVTSAQQISTDETLTLIFLPTLESRSRFVSTSPAPAGSGLTPLAAGTLATVYDGYVDSSSESFGIYLQSGTVAPPSGFTAKAGTLMIGGFDDQWGYSICPHVCAGQRALTWNAGPVWSPDVASCQGYAMSTLWPATSNAGHDGVVSFVVDGSKTTAVTGIVNLVVSATSRGNEPTALVDVDVQGQPSIATFVATDVLLTSKDSAAVPLRLGRQASKATVIVQLARLTAMTTGTDGSGAAQGVIINTHLGDGSTVDRTCIDVEDAKLTGNASLTTGAALSWSPLSDSMGSLASELLSVSNSAFSVAAPLYARSTAVSVAGPVVGLLHLGSLHVDGSSLAALGVVGWGLDGNTMQAVDLVNSTAHAQGSVVGSTNPTTPVHVLDLYTSTNAPSRFDGDTLCAHMPGAILGAADGFHVKVAGTTPTGPALYLRNTFINEPTICGTDDSNTGSAVGLYLEDSSRIATAEIGGSVICAGGPSASSQVGVFANGARVHLYDSIVGGAACGGLTTSGTLVHGLELLAVASGSLIERNWIDSGRDTRPPQASPLDVAILLSGASPVRIVSNVLSASSQVFSASPTGLNLAYLDVGFNTALLSTPAADVSTLAKAWGLEAQPTLPAGSIHENLISLPSYVLPSAVSTHTLPAGLAYDTYLLGSTTAGVTNDSSSQNFVIADPDTGGNSVFCVPGSRLTLDPHLAGAAVNVGSQSVRGLNSASVTALPADIDNQGRDVNPPNNYRGADAEANDACPTGGRPLTPPVVDTSTP